MKKGLILSILALSAAWASAQAADEALVFSYCGNYGSPIGANDAQNTVESAAIEISAELAGDWKGSSLTQVIVGFGNAVDKNVTIFLTSDLDGTPFYTQEATMTVTGGWNRVTLDTPYEVTGEPFYVGYSVNVATGTEKPIGVDNIKNSDTVGDWVNLRGYWEQVGRLYGNVCLKVGLTGDDLPQYIATIIGGSNQEIVLVDETFPVNIEVSNSGLKTIDSLSVAATINGEETEVEVSLAEGPIISGEIGIATVSGLSSALSGKNVPFTITLTAINGEPLENSADITYNGTINCAEKVFQQNVVVEEYTGTWCGWCPIGIVGMEYMAEKYGDSGFNGIAVHYGDPLQIDGYVPLAQPLSLVPGFPISMVNRKIQAYPSPEDLEYYYLSLIENPASAEVSVIKAEYSEADGITIESTAEFSFDEEEAPYRLAYVIIENKVGPYSQANSYSQNNSAYLEGWYDKASNVATIYNEVARDIKDTYGISGSVPATLKAGEKYSYSTTMPLTHIDNIDECSVVALLLDSKTGEIVNSAKAAIGKSNAGIEGIEAADSEGVVVVYNTQGLKVLETQDASQINSLPKGIYIVNGHKVYIK